MARYLVTGGGGFIGGALAKRLQNLGHGVVALGRSEYPELKNLGIETCRADIGVALAEWLPAFKGIDGVFHVAAKVEMWGPYQDFHTANVVGTKNVIEACQRNNVPRLVFTSSPSVVADGRDLCGIDEAYPYPKKYHAFYPQTKAQSEQLVRAANDTANFRTITLRPHLIFGPGDNNFVPTILERARAGRLVQVGNGENLTDLTFIDDCVEAHILAMQALERSPEHSGKIYFISQGQPVNLWGWINQILELHGLPRISRRIPWKLAQGLAGLLETVARIRGGNNPPLLTRFLVDEMATSHFFNIRAARQDLGYNPQRSIKQALELSFKKIS